MILVMLGTQKHQFNRLLKMVDELDTKKKIVIQTGLTPYDGIHESFSFSKELNTYINRANIIITHGGVGSIMEALEANKQVIVVPRLAKYGEHVDDHQQEICLKLEQDKLVMQASNTKELQACIERFNATKSYISNTKEFNQGLSEIINQLVR